MVAPLVCPGSNDAKTRGRGSDQVGHHSQRASPQKVERGSPLWGYSNRTAGKPSGKTLTLSKLLGKHISECTAPTTTMEGPMTSSTPSRRWPPPLASWALKSTKSKRCGLDKRTSRPFNIWQKVPLRASIFSGWCLPPNHLRSWDCGESISLKPFSGKQDFPSAHGVEKKVRMRAQWLTTYKWAITIWALSAASA